MTSASLDLELQFEPPTIRESGWEVYDFTLFDYTGSSAEVGVQSARVHRDERLRRAAISAIRGQIDLLLSYTYFRDQNQRA